MSLGRVVGKKETPNKAFFFGTPEKVLCVAIKYIQPLRG
jgi:hypothetical protein